MKASTQSPSWPIASDSSAAAGSAPLAARSDRLTVTSFHPTLAAGSAGRKCTPSAMLSWVSTSPSNSATSSASPRAAGSVANLRSRSITCASFIALTRRGGSRPFGDGVAQAVDETAFALVVEGVGDIDIFGDYRADRHVGAGEQFIGAGAQDGAHRAVEALEAPALGEPGADRRVDLHAAGRDAGHDIVEEFALSVDILRVLDQRPEAVIVEFLEQPGDRSRLHFLLVQRLDRGEAGRGTRAGTGGTGHQAAAVAAACPARKGPSASATGPGVSHGAKWPASGNRTMARSSTSRSSPSSCSGSSAGSRIPQTTSVAMRT